MMSNVVCGFIGAFFGFLVCSLATASKIASIHEEYAEIFYNMEKNKEKENNEN